MIKKEIEELVETINDYYNPGVKIPVSDIHEEINSLD
jgi:hypothetical protein